MSSTDEELAPLGYSARQAAKLTGISRTRIYELVAAGEFRTKRVGGRLVIDAASFREWFASLPDATS